MNLRETFWRWRHERRLAKLVGQHGWAPFGLGAYAREPTWVYSVGFDETLGQPEVILFDAPWDDAVRILWTAFELLRQGELTLQDGARFEEFTEDGVGPMWREVHPSRVSGEGWLSFACSRRARRTGSVEGLRAMQCVLPDRSGNYPWDDGYDEDLRPRQPALWLPFEEDKGGRWMLAAIGLIPPSAVGDAELDSLR